MSKQCERPYQKLYRPRIVPRLQRRSRVLRVSFTRTAGLRPWGQALALHLSRSFFACDQAADPDFEDLKKLVTIFGGNGKKGALITGEDYGMAELSAEMRK
jgi:hypothetical protein